MLTVSPKRLRVYKASAAYSANQTFTQPGENLTAFRGVRFVINLSAITGTSITFTVNAVDPISGNAVATAILASAAQASAATISLLIYPTVAAVSNKVATDVLPAKWQIVTSGTWSAATFSIHAEYIP